MENGPATRETNVGLSDIKADMKRGVKVKTVSKASCQYIDAGLDLDQERVGQGESLCWIESS